MIQERIFPKKTCCIINPNAANKKWKRRRFYRKYFKRIFPVRTIDNSEDKNQTIHTAAELCADYDIIVAAGGDGTVADVIQGIKNSGREKKMTLGIIPMGSGNAFRKSFGISKSLKRSVRLIARGKSREIDLVDIEGKAAAFGSIGATAQIVMEKLKGKIPGFFGYILASINVLRLPRREMDIELFDGVDRSGEHFEYKRFTLKVFDCVIGKTKHFGYGWRVAPDAKIDDGYIDITFFRNTGFTYLLLFPAIYIGLYQKTQKHFKAKKVIIRGDKLPLQYHGELLGIKDKIEMKIIPKVLRVISPDKMPW